VSNCFREINESFDAIEDIGIEVFRSSYLLPFCVFFFTTLCATWSQFDTLLESIPIQTG